MEILASRVRSQMRRERQGTGFDAASRAFVDIFDRSGLFLHESARDLYLEIQRAKADGHIDQPEIQRIAARFAEFVEYVEEYQRAKDQVGEVAGDVAAAAAALVVTVASGGTATPLLVAIGAASAGTAKVAVEKIVKGSDYSRSEAAGDFVIGGVDGAATVATAGLAKSVQGARVGKIAVTEAVAGGAGGAAGNATRAVMHNVTAGQGAQEDVWASALTGFGFGAAMGAGFGALVYGGTGAIQKVRMRRAEVTASRQLGHAPITGSKTGDLHGHAAYAETQLRGAHRPVSVGDVINKGEDFAARPGSKTFGTRAVLQSLRSADPNMPVVVGNHEEVLFAALDDPTRYAGTRLGVEGAALNRDAALRRLLGKRSTNFNGSVLNSYGVTGNAHMGAQLRQRSAARLRAALQQSDQALSAERRVFLEAVVSHLETGAPMPREVFAAFNKRTAVDVFDSIDADMGALYGNSAAGRRDYLRLINAMAQTQGDAEIAAREMFLLYSDAAGDMARAKESIRQLARELGVPTDQLPQIELQLRAFEGMHNDFEWLRRRMRAFHVDAGSGTLMIHAGWPYEVVNGQTVLRPESLIEAQRAVQQGRWLELSDPSRYHLSPAWAGESMMLNPGTGAPLTNEVGVAYQNQYRDFSFARPDVSARSYDDAMATFNHELRNDPDMMRRLGLDPNNYQGATYVMTGHESVKRERQLMLTARKAELLRDRPPALQDYADTLAAQGTLSPAEAIDRAAERMAQSEISTRLAAQAEFDRLNGRHLRIDPGLEDGRYGDVEAGWIVETRADGTARFRRVESSVEGRRAPQDVLVDVHSFRAQALELRHAGGIEMPIHVRQREVAKFKEVLRRAGEPVPGDDELEAFLVAYYRLVGASEGRMLDSVARALGGEPSRAAIELTPPLEAFKRLRAAHVRLADLRPQAIEQVLGRNLRSASRGVVETGDDYTKAELLEWARHHYPQATITEVAGGVQIHGDISGRTSTMILHSLAPDVPYVAYALVPSTVGITGDVTD